jgi:hypothetical protein
MVNSHFFHHFLFFCFFFTDQDFFTDWRKPSGPARQTIIVFPHKPSMYVNGLHEVATIGISLGRNIASYLSNFQTLSTFPSLFPMEDDDGGRRMTLFAFVL